MSRLIYFYLSIVSIFVISLTTRQEITIFSNRASKSPNLHFKKLLLIDDEILRMLAVAIKHYQAN